MSTTDTAMREAISWYVRQNDLDERGWTQFTEWLERDPTHAAAYDRLCLDDATTISIAPEMRRTEFVARPNWGRRRRWGVIGGGTAAVAAALALIVGEPRHETQPTLYASDTAPRALALANGLSIDMAPATRLSIAGDRSATLATGTALFKVKHDPAHPFEVRAGDHVIRDIGTVFQVSVTRTGIEVVVSEGEVAIDPDNNGWRVTAGRRLTIDPAHAEARLMPASSAEVGAWRLGHLDLAGVPFEVAVAALAHADGVEASVAPGLSNRRFTGNVKLTGDAARDMARFADLTGTVATPNGKGWVIAPEEGAR